VVAVHLHRGYGSRVMLQTRKLLEWQPVIEQAILGEDVTLAWALETELLASHLQL